MIVKAIFRPNFGDKTTGETYATQVKRHPGDLFECDDKLAKERIKKGLVVKATPEEIKEYKEKQAELKKQQETPDINDKDSENNDEIKTLDECTIEELKEIAIKENIEIIGDPTKEELIEGIKKIRKVKQD